MKKTIQTIKRVYQNSSIYKYIDSFISKKY